MSEEASILKPKGILSLLSIRRDGEENGEDTLSLKGMKAA